MHNDSAVINVGILGASGYGGAELIRRLRQHPQVKLSGLGSRQYLGQQIDACWPQLAGLLPELTFQDNDAVIDTCEVLFCATPHGDTAPLVNQALAAGKRVIDLSADFRLPPELYEVWYGHRHPHPELYEQARYGLVELHREELGGATLIANPGCNSSTAILALAPLAAANLLGDDIIVNIMTGVSGAGRGAKLPFHYTEVSDSVRPYNVAGKHRHTAEVELTLGRVKALGRMLQTHSEPEVLTVSFNPHLVPMARGIVATTYTRPVTDRELSTEILLSLYQEFYASDPLIHVQTALPESKAVWGSDRTLVSVRFDERSGHIVAFAAIDNLGKGAAGQAVQNFNVMHGFSETTALSLEGIWP
jgi:N-acetyl-gamma-glutamyl-phosphate reductase